VRPGLDPSARRRAAGDRLRRAHEALTAPRVEVALCGGPRADALRAEYRSPHPAFRVIGRKTVGVALLEVPGSFEAYLAGRERRELRNNRNRALRRGLRCEAVDAAAHLGDLLAVNRSAPVRQGAAVPAGLTDEAAVRRMAASVGVLLAVLDTEDRLLAYCDAPVLGDVAVLARLLGHADHLREGITDLLVAEVVRRCAEQRAAGGRPRWIEYGSLWTCTPGMAAFKRRLGFRPHRVRWTAGP
jgi:hypothetical protein